MTNKVERKINFESITDLFPLGEFETIKEFILKNGDRKTYRNFDNDNPHYTFKGFDVYLGSDIGQRNINNDPKISDFNQLTIADWTSLSRYCVIIITRKGDIKKGKMRIEKGMKEGETYLVDYYDKGLDVLRMDLMQYLKQVREETKGGLGK